MPQSVFFEHDGGIDDLLSLLLLLTMDDVDLLGINVTPADCFLEPALESTYKLLQLLDRMDIPIGRSEEHGVNAFPGSWRARPEVVNALPLLINLPAAPDPYSQPLAVELLRATLAKATLPVTLLVTGPCSNITLVLENDPALRQKVDKVVWMGGAFRVGGNVQTYQHDGTAEWNVFWHPEHAQRLLQLEVPIVFVPLDVTNHVPVTRAFLSRLAQQRQYLLSDLAGQFWATTIDTIPSYHYTYYMWDILATSYLAIPHAFTVESVQVDIATRPPNAGQTHLTTDGYPARIVTDVDREQFYAYLLQQFAR